MRVAVTGASGFVGVNLIDALAAAGHHITAVDRTPVSREGVARSVTADILDAAAVRDVVAGAEIVYHLAAKITLKQADTRAWEINTRGVATVAEACLAAGVRRLVHCSSVHSFDEHRCGDVMTESSPRATDPALPVYDRSKYAGECALIEVVDRGLDAVIVNPTGIYGPRDSPGHISRLNAMVLDGALGRAPASVAGSFDLVDVRDVAAGLIAAGSTGRTGENYLLPGNMVRMHQLLTVAAEAVGRIGPLVAVPLDVLEAVLPIAAPIGAAIGSDVLSASSLGHLRASPRVDGSRARAELGHRPRPFTETVRDLVAHYVRSGALASRGRALIRD